MDLQVIKKEIAEEIKQLSRVYKALGGVSKQSFPATAAVPGKRRKMSKASRAKIAAAQRARWAKAKKPAA